jgi:hypothetical protein|nr:hypothetical protein [Kofleriaceae bacterium]
MENLLEAIRAAVVTDASPEARAAGAQACRTILAALEATAAEPIQAAAAQPTTPPIADLVATLRGVPMDQLLDLAIARLRAALPVGTAVPTVQPVKFQFIPQSHLDVLGKKKR